MSDKPLIDKIKPQLVSIPLIQDVKGEKTTSREICLVDQNGACRSGVA